jgi:LacI family transcriptional regulator
MVKRPTLQDLAKAAGVSIATVDRVINRRLPVSEDTAQRVVHAAEGIGYHATSLLKRRLVEMPVRRFGFLLQKRGDAFYHQLGQELSKATTSAPDIAGKAIVDFSEELVPKRIVEGLEAMESKCDAIAVVAVDHPLLSSAVDRIVAKGKPVFTLLSDLSSSSRKAYFAADPRKAGRTAAWLVARLAPASGKVGILVGSHRYLNQELSEISFRSYLREHAPHLQLLEPNFVLDDPRVAYEATTDLIATHPDLVAIYNSGGGQDGLIQALREKPVERKITAVCNELTATTRSALIDGVIDLALATPVAALAQRLVHSMIAACDGKIVPEQVMLPAELYISENM